MKKKILIALMLLLLPVFVIINSLANSNEQTPEVEVEINNDIMINSPLFTKKESSANDTYVQPEVSMVLDGFEFVIKKGNLSLYTNKETGAIRVQNDITKYVWASDVLGIGDFGELKPSAITQLQSPFALSYRDEMNAPKTVYSTTSGVNIKLTKNANGLSYAVKARVKETEGTQYINFEYQVTLNEHGIDVKIPYSSIVETGKSALTSIRLFPYFGASFGSTIPGYIFVPSGNGGLIRFDSKPTINSTYSKSYYGTDANRSKVSSNEENNSLSLPVFGIAQGVGHNAVLASIKSGASFAQFNYEPSSNNQISNTELGITDGFHKVYNTFNYRETYNLEFGDNNIFMKPEKIYEQDVEMNYTFLTDSDADYVGMAKAYQSQLVKEGVLKPNSNSGSGNVHFDVLGGETESGIVFDKFVKMTTTEQLKEINDELSKKLGNDFIYTLRGFNKGGYSRQNASNLTFDKRLGSTKDLEGLNYYMYYNPVESYSEKASPDNKSLVNIYNEKYYLTMEENVKYKFYASVDTVTSGLNSAMSKYKNTLAIDGLYHLYGDYNNKYERYQAMESIDGLFDDTLPMFRPNAYMLDNTSHYFNMPLYHDRSRFLTDSVPFLQVLLRGYIDYYSTYLNFSTNQEIDLLKCIEYGSNLAYLISAEESYLIANTLSNHMYATHYESNKESIFEQINTATIVLNHVKNETIEDRYVVADGVVEVTYSNGVRIYVNYTSDNYKYGNIEIPTMGYKVVS